MAATTLNAVLGNFDVLTVLDRVIAIIINSINGRPFHQMCFVSFPQIGHIFGGQKTTDSTRAIVFKIWVFMIQAPLPYIEICFHPRIIFKILLPIIRAFKSMRLFPIPYGLINKFLIKETVFSSHGANFLTMKNIICGRIFSFLFFCHFDIENKKGETVLTGRAGLATFEGSTKKESAICLLPDLGEWKSWAFSCPDEGFALKEEVALSQV